MSRTIRTCCRASAALAAGVLMATANHASANVHVSDWDSTTQFEYQILQMPDLDQKREGLIADGSMHCVPTSTLNMLLYASNHGFDELLPGPGCWQCPATYGTATFSLLVLGINMGTTEETGTDGAGWIDGTEQWLDEQWTDDENKLVAQLCYATDTWAPTVNDIAYQAITGNLVAFCYGRYGLQAEGAGDTMIVGDRYSGHCVTLSRAARDGDELELWSRDPGQDEGDLEAQSIFTNNVYDAHNYACWFGGDNEKLMTALNHPVGDGLVRLIDGMHLLRPKFGYSFVPGAAGIVLAQPFGDFTVGISQTEQTIPVPAGTSFVDVAVQPDLGAYFGLTATVGGANQLLRVDPVEGTSTVVYTFSNATKLAFGRRRDLYVLSGSTLFRLNPDTPEDPVVNTVTLLHPGSAIAYDDANDMVVVLSVSQRKLMRYWYTLVTEVIPTDTIPSTIPLSGAADVAVSPTTGKVWFSSDASNSVYAIWGGAFTGGSLLWQSYSNPAIVDPQSLDLDDGGLLYVNADDGLVVLKQVTTFGMQVVPDSPFAGLDVGTSFRMARSRTNFDPAVHDGPGWENIDPALEATTQTEGVPDCIADLNFDGAVNGLDLALLLGDWGEKDSAADLNFDGIVNGLDLALLLGAWGPCAAS